MRLKEAMKNLTEDYEVGLKKGRRVSVNRGVGGETAMLSESQKVRRSPDWSLQLDSIVNE